MAKFCTSCGTQQSSSDAQFCENCGAALARPAPAPTAPPAAAAPTRAPAGAGKGFPTILVVGGLVGLLVVGGLIGLLFSGGSGPGATAKDFFWALEQGDLQEARGMMSAQLRGLLSDDKLNMALAQNQAQAQQRSGLQDIEVVQETVNGDRAVVQVKLVYGNGFSDVQSVRLVQEEGDWKIAADK